MKVDDDTYVVPSRVEAILAQHQKLKHLYLGLSLTCCPKYPKIPFASGGAGYILSRSALEKTIEKLNKYPKGEPEDVHVGKTMYESGIQIQSTHLFRGWGDGKSSIISEACATAHYINPRKQKEIHKELQSLPKQPFQIVDYSVGWGSFGIGGDLGYNNAHVKIGQTNIQKSLSAHAPSTLTLRAPPTTEISLAGYINDTGSGKVKFSAYTSSGEMLHDFGWVKRGHPSKRSLIRFPEDGVLVLRCDTMSLGGAHSVWVWDTDESPTTELILCRATFGKQQPNTIEVNAKRLLGYGIGDAIAVLPTVIALRKVHPTKRVVYKVGEIALRWIKCFVDDVESDLDSDCTCSDLEYPAQGAAADVSKNVVEDCARRCGVLPWNGRIIPKIDRNVLEWAEREVQNHRRKAPTRMVALLAPFVSDPVAASDRQFPVDQWMILAKKLKEAGITILIMDRPDNRTNVFNFQKYCEGPARSMALIGYSDFIIANNSGLAHVAGLLKKRIYCISGNSVQARRYFDWYKSAIIFHGDCTKQNWNIFVDDIVTTILKDSTQTGAIRSQCE